MFNIQILNYNVNNDAIFVMVCKFVFLSIGKSFFLILKQCEFDLVIYIRKKQIKSPNIKYGFRHFVNKLHLFNADELLKSKPKFGN